MRTRSLLAVVTLALSGQLSAASTCSATHALGEEDRAIMASVRPAAAPSTPLTGSRSPNVLLSAPDPYGRLSLDDLALIQSVQPEGGSIVLCTTTPALR